MADWPRWATGIEAIHPFQDGGFYNIETPPRPAAVNEALLTAPDCANTPTRAPRGEALLDFQHQRMRQTTVNEAIIGVLWTAQIRARPDKDVHLSHDHPTGSIL